MKRMIAAFAGKNKDFGLYLLAMRTWLAWERCRAPGSGDGGPGNLVDGEVKEMICPICGQEIEPIISNVGNIYCPNCDLYIGCQPKL